MNRPSADASFAARISRSLAVATGVLVAVVLLVGGTSLVLAARIFLNNDAVAEEYDHLLKLDQVHSVFDDLIFELHQMDSTGRIDHTADALLMQEEIVRQLAALGETHRGQVAAAEQEREQAGLGALHRLSEEGRAVTKRLAAGPGRLAEPDLEWLNLATHEVPRHTGELAESHRSRISSLLDSSQRLIEAIIALYAAFIVVGAALVVVAAFAANRGLASPLRRLAEAAQGIAEGRLETRVRVTSRNEIGLLSHGFNAMADRLQEHERELQRAHGALQEKVREAQALYEIGMEISRLQKPDRTLQSVVDKARELLRGDAVALCLFSPGGGELAAQATSGAPEAFRAPGEAGEARPAEGVESGDAVGLVIRPEYARAHLAAPLRVGEENRGVLCVGVREEREFTAGEVALLAGLAAQAAIAIERARLSEEVRSLAALEERERLAREMHDGLAQALGLLHMKLQGALRRSADSPATAADLREMVHITDGAYEEVRQSIFGLRTFVSRGLSLVPTLTEYLHEFSAHNGVAVELEVPGGPLGPVPPASEVQAVRIIQEALTNVRKHAQADHARVRLQRDGAWLRVTVEDDGVGWDRRDEQHPLHYGLQTMRERAEGVGGRLEVDTAPGRGTRVVATLPGGIA